MIPAPTPADMERDAVKTKRTSPTQLTIKALEKLGATVGIVERFNAFAGPLDKRCQSCGKNRIGVKQDLFGVFDLLAILGPNTIGIQVTQGGGIGKSNAAARRRKILAEPRVLSCLKANWIVEVWNWSQPGGPGTRWVSSKEEITLSDFPANPPAHIAP